MRSQTVKELKKQINQVAEDAYNLPDETRQQQKIRRKAMKKANKEKNIYIRVATPYLSALRTVQLAEGYENLSEILSGYEDAVAQVKAQREESEEKAKELMKEQKLDAERKKAQRRMKIKK